jgi:aldehyde dehydrogenase (NAD+)
MKIAEQIKARTAELAVLEAKSMGRPVSNYFDAHYAYMQFSYFSQAAYAAGSSSLNTPGSINLSLRQPYGVVAAVIPWNAPLVFLSKKLAPALAAGNTVILKTSERAPLTSDLVAHLLEEAGFPKGVVNVLHGHGMPSGDTISKHMKIRALSFTGSVGTGRKIMRAAADSNFKHLIFELGGKSPAVVFEDADLEETVKGCFAAIMSNSGQSCFATSRVYVQKSIGEEFKKMFQALLQKRKMGDPEDKETESGPVADKEQWKRVNGLLDEASANGSTVQGGELTNGASAVNGTDYFEKGNAFVKPTVLYDQAEDSKIMKEEVFGPVVCINPFETEEEVLNLANDTEYGLYAAVYTKDLDRALRVARRLESGMVGVNTNSPAGVWDLPFGGFKNSGVGREGFLDSLSDWLETKSVYIKVKGLVDEGGPSIALQ